jgi:predicted Zn-dependent protease
MDEFEHSFSIEPYRGYMKVEKPFDLYFHEEGIGLGIAQKIAAQKGLVNDDKATRYINLIGNYLSQFTRAYDLGFRFYILNDNRASAFSCPGGYIFITKGILQICSNESELAGIIAHEMAHVVQRHGLKELHLNTAKIEAEKAFSELEDETGEMSEEEKDLESYADNAYQNIISPRLLSYELEADKIAMAYLKRAGYDPTSVVSVLEKIQEAPTTHPDIFDDNYMKKDDMQERLIKARAEVRDEGYRALPSKHFNDRFNFYTSDIRK